MHRTIHLYIKEYSEAAEGVRRPRILFRVLAVGLGVLHVYAAIRSQSMNADGISYLDIGDAYFRADWANAINSVWSPLYSWLLGLANFVFRPPTEWEFPAVHLINLLVYLGSLASFEFMWSNIRLSRSPAEQAETLRIPDWLWWMLGYLLFIWTTLSLIQIWSVTPDMLMACTVFLAAGFVARIRAGQRNLCSFISLGLVLGLGYLSKTFMFSIALVFLGLSAILLPRRTASFINILSATGIFLLISLPFILLISEKKGKLTIGEAGTITYLRYVNGIPFPHWQGDPLVNNVPAHASRIIHRSPTVYEFGEPVGGTYPISTDPSYWYEGIRPRFDFGSLLARLSASSLVYADLFFQKQGFLFACVLALYAMGQKKRYTFLEILRQWLLVIPALIAFGLYGSVLVQDRYVGAFIPLFWADILANTRLPDTLSNRSWLTMLCVVGSVGLFGNIIVFNLDGFNRLNPSLHVAMLERSASPAKPLEVAQALRALGIKQDDRVGVIGYAYDSFWARLARVKIVAEMLEADAGNFWLENRELQQGVLNTFAHAGTDAVVAENVPEHTRLIDWHQVGDSSYYIYVFTKQ